MPPSPVDESAHDAMDKYRRWIDGIPGVTRGGSR